MKHLAALCIAGALTACAAPQPSSVPHTSEPLSSNELAEALSRRASVSQAFVERPRAVAHPDDTQHCAAVLSLAQALASQGTTQTFTVDADAVRGAKADRAEGEFLRRAAEVQRDVVRLTMARGLPVDDERSALAALQSLSPLIPVPANARAGTPSARGAALPEQSGTDTNEKYKAYEDYMKRKGFKSHPSYTPGQ